MTNRKKILYNLIYSLSAIGIMWIGWFIIYKINANEYILPSPSDSVIAAFQLFTESQFWVAFSGTLLRTLAAFVISFAFAFVFSVLSHFSETAKGILKPIIGMIRTVPTMAVILALLIWTSPKAAPVIVVFLVSFPLAYSSFTTAAENVDYKLIEMSKVYGLSSKDRIFKIYIPLSVPYVMGEIGTQLAFSLKVMVSAEVLSKTYRSIGGLMSEAKNFVEMPRLIALTIIVVACGLLFEALGSLIKKAFVRWRV